MYGRGQRCHKRHHDDDAGVCDTVHYGVCHAPFPTRGGGYGVHIAYFGPRNDVLDIRTFLSVFMTGNTSIAIRQVWNEAPVLNIDMAYNKQ
jgi:hypothetical protein